MSDRPIDTLCDAHRAWPSASAEVIARRDQSRAALTAVFELFEIPVDEWTDETFDAVATVLLAQSLLLRRGGVLVEPAWELLVDFVAEAAS